MKKVLLGLFAILFLLIFSNAPFTTIVYATMTESVSTSVDDGILTAYTGNETTVIVPEGVTKIESYVFNNNNMEYIILPNSLKEIDSWSFYKCSNLKEITIPPNVRAIGSQAFAYCTSLTDIIIPESVDNLGYNVFEGCSNLTNITINTKTNISIDMFSGTKWLNDRASQPYITMNDILLSGKTTGNIVVPDGVTKIGESAFDGTQITSVKIPSSVLSIGDRAFAYCFSLKEIKFSEGLKEIGYGAFLFCKGLTTVTLPSSIEVLGVGAFSDCINLHTISLPQKLEHIPGSLLEGNKKLEFIKFPKQLKSIGWGAFTSTLWLSNAKKKNPMVIIDNILVDGSSCKGAITIPNNITYIVANAFYGSAITSVTVPEGVKAINQNTFLACKKLTTVKLPSSITTIDFGAFNACIALKKIILPKNLKAIGNYAFCNCTKLSSITFNTKLVSIDDYAFMNCSSITSLSFPASLETIGNRVFSDCINLTTVKMKEGITKIDTRAFYNCMKLKNITFPAESLEYIGGMAFHKTAWLTNSKKNNKMIIIGKVLYDATGCSGDVVIPENVVTITAYAFNCKNRVDSVTVPTSVTNISDLTFFECKYLITLIVPKDSYALEYAKSSNMHYVIR